MKWQCEICFTRVRDKGKPAQIFFRYSALQFSQSFRNVVNPWKLCQSYSIRHLQMQISVNTYNYTLATVCFRQVWNNDWGVYAVEFIFIHLRWQQYLCEELEKEAWEMSRILFIVGPPHAQSSGPFFVGFLIIRLFRLFFPSNSDYVGTYFWRTDESVDPVDKKVKWRMRERWHNFPSAFYKLSKTCHNSVYCNRRPNSSKVYTI